MPVELRAFSGVAKNQRNQLDITPGATLADMEIISNINDVTKFEKVQLELNGTMIVDVTGADLKMLEAYDKRSRGAGRYIISFIDPTAKTVDGMRVGELVTLPTDNLTLYVTLGDTGATVPTLRARAHVTPAQAVRHFVPKIDVINVQASNDGENQLDWNVRSPNLHIQRLHLQKSDISKLKVYRDDLKVFEATRADNNVDLADAGEKSPQANNYHFDPAYLGYRLQGLFPTIARKELVFKYDVAAAGNLRVLRQTIEQVASAE